MNHIVMYSGGVGSWLAARRLLAEVDPKDVLLLFTDTRIEDPDLYRFLGESSQKLGCELARISEGRDPWEVFRDKRFIGNTRADPCSRILKRDLALKWVRERHPPESVVLHFGIDFTEEHRVAAVQRYWKPYRIRAILCEPPLLTKQDAFLALEHDGLRPPLLYLLGFPHNNCGGFCVKAGQAHFRHLYEQFPDRFFYHEEREQELRAYLGKDVAILRDRRGGITRPLTLRDLRNRIEKGEIASIDPHSWGGCGCFTED